MFLCIQTHSNLIIFLAVEHLHALLFHDQLPVGWGGVGGGVGWGGVGWDDSVICCTFSCTCTHTACYAAVRSHALAHIRHATLCETTWVKLREKEATQEEKEEKARNTNLKTKAPHRDVRKKTQLDELCDDV